MEYTAFCRMGTNTVSAYGVIFIQCWIQFFKFLILFNFLVESMLYGTVLLQELRLLSVDSTK